VTAPGRGVGVLCLLWAVTIEPVFGWRREAKKISSVTMLARCFSLIAQGGTGTIRIPRIAVIGMLFLYFPRKRRSATQMGGEIPSSRN
jgi:hypothetical protein